MKQFLHFFCQFVTNIIGEEISVKAIIAGEMVNFLFGPRAAAFMNIILCALDPSLIMLGIMG